ncbi:site-specific integrase (plasmid) [Verrucomicrobiaceae bacterium 227]
MSESLENQGLEPVPDRKSWFEGIENDRTIRSYETSISDFLEFLRDDSASRIRKVSRKDVEDWRDDLVKRGLSAPTIRVRMAGVSYLYDLLAEKGVIPANPVAGVKRPTGGSGKKRPASFSQSEIKKLVDLPDKETVKGARDRALLAVLAYHQISPEEIEGLLIGDLQERASDGLPCFSVRDGAELIRLIPIHAGALQRIYQYLAKVEQGDDLPLFRPMKNNVTKTLDSSLSASGIRKGVVKFWRDRASDSMES